ncbi:hypothetical protein HYV44_03790 [Candidatus Microgenomates bacterium]|nr:hypothetical protein [Candidatus Microgenomates bacterium]
MVKKIHIFVLVALILLATTTYISPAQAAEVKCITSGCSANPGDTVKFKVQAVDTLGNPIYSPVRFKWSVIADNGKYIGDFTLVAGKAPIGDTHFPAEINSPGPNSLDEPSYSSASIKIPAIGDLPIGKIKVEAFYGGTTTTAVYEIITACTRDPKLYFAIGEVKEAGASNTNWHKATAEILETCREEYRLFGSTTSGQGK